jgi:hypothetical protein
MTATKSCDRKLGVDMSLSTAAVSVSGTGQNLPFRDEIMVP